MASEMQTRLTSALGVTREGGVKLNHLGVLDTEEVTG